MVLVVGYQVYALTKSPLALGLLGLIEAIPALSLALFGGHVADRYDRRRILLAALGSMAICAALLGLQASLSTRGLTVWSLYGLMFIVGIARSFSGPAISALEAQVVPLELIVKSATWFSATWLVASVCGPVLGGYAFAHFGPASTFFLVAALIATAWLSMWFIRSHPVPPPRESETVWQSILEGIRYVVSDQILLGSMALDLFAVLFGGAIALLPVFADEILHIGPDKLGLLSAAPNTGALVTMLIATRYPPMRHAGKTLLLAVTGFGISMLVFALSKNFYLSLVALLFSGIFDGLSVVIRKSIVRLLSPNHLRGRIASVSLIFIGSSNELGALESGIAASWLGTVRSVVAGGVVTLMIAVGTALAAPKLRRLRLDRPDILSEGTTSPSADSP
jgi:MFS family permease